ncbi:hypothetical protein DIPPA_13268 [Diplonema papillatum]|nr:hypothetical protein DIPPA_13268 [Diplonema papillatum]
MFTTMEPVLPAGLRLKSEKYFKTVNLILGIGSLACVLIAAGELERGPDTMTNFWGVGSTTVFKEKLRLTLDNCVLATNVDIGSYDVRYNMTVNTALPLAALSATVIKRAILISAAAVVLSLVNKILFNYNVHQLRFYSFVVSKAYLMLLEFLFTIWALADLVSSQGLAQELTDYLDFCSGNSDTPAHVFTAPPFIPLYVAFSVLLLGHCVTAGILLSHSARRVPPEFLAHWEDICLLLSKCPKKSAVPAYVESCLHKEINGYENLPGIKHLLAQDLMLLDPAALQPEAVRVPPDFLAHWEDICLLLSKCPKKSAVPAYVESCLHKEINGYENPPGIKHLLAQDLMLLDPAALQPEAVRSVDEMPARSYY